ncbi:glycosyltransferase family 4 protein [Nocardia sp. NRRL S-836]|uniref:glycosyltransferase family 4 protein n=1 Tax=Nocardia sp. NRRL S-836 TaxID=1519492 RepID=UPI0006AF7FB5|nr:glycosyltransferase family 4 protein [Nocardia sp. NRRL S-836]
MNTRRHVLVVFDRDLTHPAAAEGERYVHEVVRRWAAGGTRVTLAVTGTPAHEVVTGVEVRRFARPAALVAWLLRHAHRFDAVVDATDGAVATAWLAVRGRTPVVRLELRSHRTGLRRLPVPVRRRLARWAGDRRTTVVPSPSARHELRCRVGLRGPVLVAPPGAAPATGTGERADHPVVVVPAPERGLDVLLRGLPLVLAQNPELRVEVLGDGPELPRLWRIAHDFDVAHAVVLRGRVSDDERAATLRRAWLLVSAAVDELPAQAVLEAAAHGVPCVALDAVGARDFVRVGEVVRSPDDLAPAVARHLAQPADPRHAEELARRCRGWADGFRWDRTAGLLAAAVEHEVRTTRRDGPRRRARFDIATAVRLPAGARVPAGALRVTDEVVEAGGAVGVLLNGCDEFDALGVLDRLGIEGAHVRLATHDDLMLGPCPHAPATEPTRKVDDRVHSR